MIDELRFERVIDAPPDVVFEAFTTDGGQRALYGQDDPGWIVESDCDLGKTLMTMTSPASPPPSSPTNTGAECRTPSPASNAPSTRGSETRRPSS